MSAIRAEAELAKLLALELFLAMVQEADVEDEELKGREVVSESHNPVERAA